MTDISKSSEQLAAGLAAQANIGLLSEIEQAQRATAVPTGLAAVFKFDPMRPTTLRERKMLSASNAIIHGTHEFSFVHFIRAMVRA